MKNVCRWVLAILLMCGCVRAFAEENTFQNFATPAWDTLKFNKTPDNNVWVVPETGRAAAQVYSVPRMDGGLLNARTEDGALVFDATKILEAKAVSAQLQVFGLDAKAMADHDFCMYIDVQGPAGALCKFYYEGRTKDGKHYWRCLEVHLNGQRQVFAFDEYVPVNIDNIFMRYDFFTPGEYRYFGTRVEMTETTASALDTKKPELIFHAPFDGTATAAQAGGAKEPKRAENLRFTDGLQGQGAAFFKDPESGKFPILQYFTQGNLEQEQGTISVWVKLDWQNDPQHRAWRHILTEPWTFPTRIGSGAVWFWVYEGKVRGDTSDLLDRYTTCTMPSEAKWVHLTYTWSPFIKRLYVDGKLIGHLGDSANKAQPLRSLRYVRLPFEDFFVGCYQNQPLQGVMDELRIYSGPLSNDEVQTLYREFRSIRAVDAPMYYFDDAPVAVRGCVENSAPETTQLEAVLKDAEGMALQKVAFTARPSGKTEFEFPASSLAEGLYTFEVLQKSEVVDVRSVSVFHPRRTAAQLAEQRENLKKTQASKSCWAEDLRLKLLETIDPTAIAPERISAFGTLSVKELGGKRYLETQPERHARFAIHLKPLEAGKVYCFEWDFPDNAQRTVDIIAQSSKRTCPNEYELQTGYLTGDEYPTSGEMLTQRCLFWSRADDMSLVFMTARNTEAGAAVGEIRIYEVENEELPLAVVNPARPVNGWTRPVGIYFEDPAISYDFAADGSDPAQFERMLDHTCEYMKFSGQNMLCYPVVWYNGPIGEKYNPRNHVPQFMEGFLEKFDREGLEFMATFNQNNVAYETPILSRPDIRTGRLYDSEFSIHETGTPHPGGWHGTPPIFNTLHPQVQAMTLRQLDDILAVAAPHPSFKGIILHLPRHALHSLGDIRAGYNDYLIDKFEKDCNIQIPVDKASPVRGKLAYEWLRAPGHEAELEAWIDWRCRKIADWYKTLAARIAKARPDLKLGINCMIPILYEPSPYDAADARDFWEKINREAGIDAKYFADVPNMFIEQTVFPADYRWMQDRSKPELRARLRNTEETAGMYGSLMASPQAWIHHHDRYWESDIGTSKTLNTEWFTEHTWRVSTLNPTRYYAMKHYLAPFRYKDIQGISKGGFLIGTYGMESYLVPFAAAFRALPAVSFDDMPQSTETVKLRKHTEGSATWFYIANTSDQPAVTEVPVNAEFVVDLARNVRVRVKDGTLTVKTQPYQLRSFRFVEKQGGER